MQQIDMSREGDILGKCMTYKKKKLRKKSEKKKKWASRNIECNICIFLSILKQILSKRFGDYNSRIEFL